MRVNFIPRPHGRGIHEKIKNPKLLVYAAAGRELDFQSYSK